MTINNGKFEYDVEECSRNGCKNPEHTTFIVHRPPALFHGTGQMEVDHSRLCKSCMNKFQRFMDGDEIADGKITIGRREKDCNLTHPQPVEQFSVTFKAGELQEKNPDTGLDYIDNQMGRNY